MYKKLLTLTLFLLCTSSIHAMDLNQTKTIILEATQATATLQNEFDEVFQETALVAPVIHETNTSIEKNCTLLTKEENTTVIIVNSVNLDKNMQTEDILGKSIHGLIIFKTKIKPFCDMNGEDFAKQYMQEDWDDIYHDKEFKKELLKACPKLENDYQDKWTPHLYQFTLEYASDSDAIPEC